MSNKYTVLGFVIMLIVLFLELEGLGNPVLYLPAFVIGLLITIISVFRKNNNWYNCILYAKDRVWLGKKNIKSEQEAKLKLASPR